MPTYSYLCRECDNAFDIQQGFTDDTLTVCPSCGGVLRKVFSPIGVSFIGSGFYRNDSRAKPVTEKVSAGKADTVKSDAGKSDASKTDVSKSSTKEGTALKTPTPTRSGGSPATTSKAAAK
ncbi:MAG: FmdB family zinc ribbon protein [Terrimesophilobacter sp.]